MDQKIAVVTGGNRGIGLEICRQLAQQGMMVILTARDHDKGRVAAKTLGNEGIAVDPQSLDVTQAHSVRALRDYVDNQYGRLDILINNAGVLLDRNEPGLSVDIDKVEATFETNVYGPLRLCQMMVPLMKKHNYGRIVNVSSRMGQLSEMQGNTLAYRVSKVALNGLTAVLAQEVGGYNILINTMTPGWVRTDMGGSNAARSVQEGADTVVWLALLPDSGPNGGFFYERKPIPW